MVERERAYLAEPWEAETRLAAALAERAAAPDDELFDPPGRPERIEVSDEQWEIVELVRTRQLVLLTGLPGAGKTHTQRVVVELGAPRRRTRRALRADGEGGAADARPDRARCADDPPRARLLAEEDRFLRDEDDPLSNDVELVIVDEASMLSLELADALFRAAGDCHVLLVGDTDQLPPIGPGRVLADLVESDAAPRVHLTAIYRQAARSSSFAAPAASTGASRRSSPCRGARRARGSRSSTRTSSGSRARVPRPCGMQCSSSSARHCRGAASTLALRS